MGNRLTYSSLSDDISQQFDSDWSDAQELYRKGVDSGYSENDAYQLYLQPIRDKYKILESSPELMQNPARLEKFHNEYDGSLDSFYNSISKGEGYKLEDAFGRYVRPVQEKWASGTRLPIKNRLPISDARLISGLPQQIINETKQTTNVPQANIGTDTAPKYAPYAVKMTAKHAEAVRKGTLNNLKSGMDLADAERKATEDEFGTSPTFVPNTYIKNPAIAAQPKWHGVPFTGTDAQPAELGTNYFRLEPGQLDSGVVGEDIVNKPVRFNAPQENTQQIPIINSQKEYDDLSEGAQYMDSNGKIAVKKRRK
jgi:hypothetical protein